MNILQSDYICPPVSDLDGLERDRKWFLAFGIFSIILGLVALSVPLLTTLLSVIFLGSILLVSGIFQIFRSLGANRDREFPLHLVIGVLYGIVGIIIIFNPAISAVSFTLLFAAFFIAAGALRIIRAAVARFSNWAWMVLSGIVTLALGILVWAGWPVSGLWVIGLFVGIEMVLYGWSIVMLASAEREEIRHIRNACGEIPAMPA